MSHNYDNWERLVRAVLLREELIEIALRDSRDPSTTSDVSSSSSNYNDLISVGSNSSFPVLQPLIKHPHKYKLPKDYSDLTMNHTDWKAMLPSGENEVVWKSASLSFSLDKRTGKHCFMVGPRGLVIQPKTHREFIFNSESRFSEVAETKFNSEQIYIKCSIEKQRLSTNTIYGAYLVFKLGTLPSPSDDESDDHFFLNDLHKELYSSHLFLTFKITTFELPRDETVDRVIYIQGHKWVEKRIITTRELNLVDRGNGWKEVEIGNLYVKGKKKEEVRVELYLSKSLEAHLKGRLIVEGIEFRPTNRRSHLFGSFRPKTTKDEEKQNQKMSFVFKVKAHSDEEKRNAMKAVCTLAGVEYVYMNKKEMKLTVVGYFSTLLVLRALAICRIKSFLE